MASWKPPNESNMGDHEHTGLLLDEPPTSGANNPEISGWICAKFAKYALGKIWAPPAVGDSTEH